MSRTNKSRGYNTHSYRTSNKTVLKEYRVRGNRNSRRKVAAVLYRVKAGKLPWDRAVLPQYPQERFDLWSVD